MATRNYLQIFYGGDPLGLWGNLKEYKKRRVFLGRAYEIIVVTWYSTWYALHVSKVWIQIWCRQRNIHKSFIRMLPPFYLNGYPSHYQEHSFGENGQKERIFVLNLLRALSCPILSQINHGQILCCPMPDVWVPNYLNFIYWKCILLLFYLRCWSQELRINKCLQSPKDQLAENEGNMGSLI